MLTHILGGCGTGKSTKLMQQLRADLETGQKVFVLVPEQFSFEAEKKLYDFLGAQLFNQLRTYSFATLSRDILQTYGTAARTSYASEQEKLLYLYQAVQYCMAQKELTLLERRAGAPDFVMELYDLVTKIRKASVSAETLETASLVFPDALGRKTSDIGRILLAYDRILQEHGRTDSLVNLTEAAGIADMQYFFEGIHVYIDEFDSFTGDQYRMLEVILKQAADIAIAVRADDPHQRPTGMFLGGNNTFFQLRRMASDLSLQEEVQYLPEYRRSAHPDLAAVGSGNLRRESGSVPYEGHVHILEAADPVMEVEYI
ncbi:MAG: hypothetical protein K2I93_06175, partial [Oscillospiraceae bacterium]|nr:hypothetical protein [Oscillospiraceae bacterium]